MRRWWWNMNIFKNDEIFTWNSRRHTWMCKKMNWKKGQEVVTKTNDWKKHNELSIKYRRKFHLVCVRHDLGFLIINRSLRLAVPALIFCWSLDKINLSAPWRGWLEHQPLELTHAYVSETDCQANIVENRNLNKKIIVTHKVRCQKERLHKTNNSATVQICYFEVASEEKCRLFFSKWCSSGSFWLKWLHFN